MAIEQTLSIIKPDAVKKNVIGQIYPKMSWVAQYQGLREFIPGIYAMSVNQSGTENLDQYEEDYWLITLQTQEFGKY